MKELTDSSSLVGDPESLRARLSVDGYLFFRGLLPAGPVAEAGAAAAAALAAGGWMDSAGAALSEPKAVNAAEAVRDPAFLAAATSRQFNRIPYLPQLRTLVRSVLCTDAFSYPVKVLRAVYPEAEHRIPRGRYIHQDFAVARVSDLLTSWVPLMPIPVSVGGLALLPGSNMAPPIAPQPLSSDQPGWATADYRLGDVVLFHCLTSHAALPNRSSRLRLSQDSRWQSARQPAPGRMIYGPVDPSRGEALARVLRFQPWWEPVPAKLTIRDEQARTTPPWSRFFTVHPGWAAWQPRTGPVH